VHAEYPRVLFVCCIFRNKSMHTTPPSHAEGEPTGRGNQEIEHE
jgi:hypothetical protein